MREELGTDGDLVYLAVDVVDAVRVLEWANWNQ